MDRVDNLMWLLADADPADRDRGLINIALRLLARDPDLFGELLGGYKKSVEEKEQVANSLRSFFVPEVGRIEMTQIDIDRIAAIYDHSHRWVAAIKHAREHMFPNGANGNGALYTAKYVCEYLRDHGLIPDHRTKGGYC